tara:strand:+ start:25 stop:483 length:459 start_codon:yes stop_codon:yes gene_type:complete
MTVKIDGIRALETTLSALNDVLDGAITDAIKGIAEEVKREAVFSIRETSGGEVVRRYGVQGGYDHVASKVGDAPNDDTGDLVASIKIAYTNDDFIAHVYTELNYGLYLETVLDRPWLQPALDKVQPEFKRVLTSKIRKHLRDTGVYKSRGRR